jgi:hypothetical protein
MCEVSRLHKKPFHITLASIGKEFALNAVILSWVPTAIQDCSDFLVNRGLLAEPQEAAD